MLNGLFGVLIVAKSYRGMQSPVVDAEQKDRRLYDQSIAFILDAVGRLGRTDCVGHITGLVRSPDI